LAKFGKTKKLPYSAQLRALNLKSLSRKYFSTEPCVESIFDVFRETEIDTSPHEIMSRAVILALTCNITSDGTPNSLHVNVGIDEYGNAVQ